MSDASALTAPPGRPGYATRALKLQYNWILLGGAALFSLASASPIPLALGVVGELAWLGIGSNLGAVRRWLDRREAFSVELAADAEAAPESHALDREHAPRLYRLDEALGELRALAGPRAEPAFKQAVPRLAILRAEFYAACEAHQGVLRFLGATPEAELERELESLQQAVTAEKDLGVKLGLRQALVLAKRRVEQRRGMAAELTTLSLRLDTLERAVSYLLAQGRAIGANRQLADEIDVLVTQLGRDKEKRGWETRREDPAL